MSDDRLNVAEILGGILEGAASGAASETKKKAKSAVKKATAKKTTAKKTTAKKTDSKKTTAKKTTAKKTETKKKDTKKEEKTTSSSVTITRLKKYKPDDVKRIRKETGYSMKNFAGYIGVTEALVKAWENGDEQPEGPACRILAMMDMDEELTTKYPFVKKKKA